jgi:hypothetical protein
MERRWARWVFLWIVAAAFFAGCGDNPLGRKAISGQVTLNGQPLGSGSIEFTPLVEGGVGSGGLIENGSYTISADQGLPPGKYRVSIIDNPPAPPLPAGHMPGDPLPPPPKPLIPANWNSKSEQTIEVKPEGPFTFNFDVKTK